MLIRRYILASLISRNMNVGMKVSCLMICLMVLMSPIMLVDGGNVRSVLCEFAWFCLIYCKNDKTVLAAVARIQIS